MKLTQHRGNQLLRKVFFKVVQNLMTYLEVFIEAEGNAPSVTVDYYLFEVSINEIDIAGED